ncbi:MAG: MBL fold metallo-hydrolase [Betaproteobacteria bacterium]|nr:MBL fold metallo-hydrolase [Betaproteobacteria bacterium]MDH3437926.1 MBL fold metallo-hydrolase [Betaproteobacteria bacterium]
MRFASLGSGSGGNALLVEAGNTLILLDCGFGLAEVTARLARIGLVPGDIDAIIVTHEHDDHAGGVARLVRRHELPVYLTYGTLAALGGDRAALPEAVLIDGHAPFAIGDIEVQPYPVPHDAREPVQFVLADGAARLGVLTDVGAPTPYVAQMLSGLEALVLECNHDRAMLEASAYPATLRERIAGRFGHLENAAAAQLLGELDCSRLQHVIAGHLSQQNNTPELARAALAGALGCEAEWIGVATQDEGFTWRQIL